MSVNGYLFAAYAVIWTILFVYLAYLNRKQKQVGRDLEDIAEAEQRRSSREDREKRAP